MNRTRISERGFSMLEILFVLVLFSIIVGIAVVRFPLFSISCAGVDTAAEGLTSDMRLAKSLAQNNQKDYSVELLTDNPAGVTCYDNDPTLYPYNRYQIIDKSDGSVYKNETKTFNRNVVALPGVTPPCGCGGGIKCEQKFVFASDGTEGTKDSAGAPASGNKVRVQSTSQGGCPRNYDVSVEPTTGKITITKN